jgi:hypothetical protein
MKTKKTVTIYFDKVDISQKPYRVLIGCESIEKTWKEATEYAEKKISDKEWSEYLIPELTSVETIIEGESKEDQETLPYIDCICGNKETIEEGPEETNNFFHSGGNNFICSECYNEVKSNI